MKNVTKNEIIIITMITMIIIIVGVFLFEYIDILDDIILKFIRTNFTSNILKNVMYVISMILMPIPILLIFGIFVLLCRNKIVPLMISLNSGAAILLNTILKNIFRRDRPFEYFLVDEVGYSFPSAHAMVGAAFYGTLIYCTNNYIKNSKLKIFLNIILWLLLILTPISRVYLGVHNLSDVLIGTVLGIIILKICIYIVNKLQNKIDRLEEAK